MRHDHLNLIGSEKPPRTSVAPVTEMHRVLIRHGVLVAVRIFRLGRALGRPAESVEPFGGRDDIGVTGDGAGGDAEMGARGEVEAVGEGGGGLDDAVECD